MPPMQMTRGTCALCLKDAELQLSHVIPSFAYAWLKATGTPYIRQPTNPNKRQQDGKKVRLLCSECEQRFAAKEKWFKEKIFDRYIEGSASLPYDENLFYFAISLVWRVLVTSKRQHRDLEKFQPALTTTGEEWRRYLLAGECPKTFDDVHLFFTDIGTKDGEQPIINWSRYLARAVDATIGYNSKNCFVYAKFARFVFFAGVTPVRMSGLVGTKIDAGASSLHVPQKIKNELIGTFLIDRARQANEMYERGLSDRQRQKIIAHLIEHADDWVNSDMGAAMLADRAAVVDPAPLLTKKPGRNDLCPCGSGRKFKKCHG
jgi:hypothetical protein